MQWEMVHTARLLRTFSNDYLGRVAMSYTPASRLGAPHFASEMWVSVAARLNYRTNSAAVKVVQLAFMGAELNQSAT